MEINIRKDQIVEGDGRRGARRTTGFIENGKVLWKKKDTRTA